MSEEGKTIGRRVAESAAREAEGSYADWWAWAYIQDCRDGKRKPMFTPSGVVSTPTPAPSILTINEFH